MSAVSADVQMATTRNPRGFRFSPISARGLAWVRRFQRGYDDCASLYLTPQSSVRVVDEMTTDGLVIECEHSTLPEPPIPKA